MLRDLICKGCDTEHGTAFVEASAAVLAATLLYDDVPCDEALACNWAVQVSSTAFEWKAASALNLLIVLMELDRRRGSIHIHLYVVHRMFSKIETHQLLRCPELMIKLVAWLSCAKYERQLSAGLLTLWAQSRATDMGRERLIKHERVLFSTFVKCSSAPIDALLLLLKHPQKATRLTVIDMIERWVKMAESDITSLLRCGLLDALSSLLMKHSDEISDSACENEQLCATLHALTAVIWHEDCQESIVQSASVMDIGQWCETALQNIFSSSSQSLLQEHTTMLTCVVRILGGMSSKLMQPDLVASFIFTNKEILQELMQTMMRCDACSLVLLCLRAIYSQPQTFLLPFSFFHVLQENLTSMAKGSSNLERAVAVSGIVQLYSSNYEWESAQDEQGMEAEKGHALAEAEALQIVLILIQQALVDKTWPCAWRLCLPSLLDTMLSSSMHGKEIASHGWQLEVARCGYSNFASCGALDIANKGGMHKKTSVAERAALEPRAGGLMVWLAFMCVMLKFSAGWLSNILTPDNLSRLVTITRTCLEDKAVLLAWLRFWTELAPRLAISDTQKSSLQKTLRRAFESTPKDEPLISRAQASAEDTLVLEAACGTAPSSLLIRLLDVTVSSADMPHNLRQQIVETMHSLSKDYCHD